MRAQGCVMEWTGVEKENRKRKSSAVKEERKDPDKKKNTQDLTPVITIDDDSDGDEVIVQKCVQKNDRVHRDSELRTFVKFSGGNSGYSRTEPDVINWFILDKGNSDMQRASVHASEVRRDSYTNALGKELTTQKHQASSHGDVTGCAPVRSVPLQKVLQEGLSVVLGHPGNTNLQEKLEDMQQQPTTQLSVELYGPWHHILQQRFSLVKSPVNTIYGKEKQQREGHQLQQPLVDQKPSIQDTSMSLAQRGAEFHIPQYSNGQSTTKSSSGYVSQSANKRNLGQLTQNTRGLESLTSHPLNEGTAPTSQQKHDVENVAGTQQHFSKVKLLHDTIYQQNRHQTSQVHQQSSGHYMPQYLSEQCVRVVPPQSLGCTLPQPNVQPASCAFQECSSQFPQYPIVQSMDHTVRSHNECSALKEESCHSIQAVSQHQQFSNEQSAQFMYQTSLQPSGQHNFSGVQGNSGPNTYHTLKQPFQQTASELPPPPSEKYESQCPLCVSLNVEQSGEQIVLKIPNQYSGQISIKMSGRCDQKNTLQSVQELCEPKVLNIQQQQKQQAESHIVLRGERKRNSETESCLRRPSDSNFPRNPSILSETVQELHTDRPLKTELHTERTLKTESDILSELGLKEQQQQQQQQWQLEQYMPRSRSQEPQQHTPIAESDTGPLQAPSRSQLQEPRTHLQQLSQQQNSKVTANPDNSRLNDKEGNESSDTESVCKSSAGSPNSLPLLLFIAFAYLFILWFCLPT